MAESADAIVPAQSTDSTKKKSAEVVKAQPAPRSVDEIEADMAATRARLSETLDELKVATNPKNVANRQLQKVKDFYTDEYGAVRVDRVAGTVAVVVTVVIIRRSWKKRH
jgi:hypothetical protein